MTERQDDPDKTSFPNLMNSERLEQLREQGTNSRGDVEISPEVRVALCDLVEELRAEVATYSALEATLSRKLYELRVAGEERDEALAKWEQALAVAELHAATIAKLETTLRYLADEKHYGCGCNEGGSVVAQIKESHPELVDE